MISFLDGRVVLYPGDCLEILAAMPENSVDAACMDPPYHLTSIVDRFGKGGAAEVKPGATGAYVSASAGFMGKAWDGGDIAFQAATWAAVLRVLKPGGYLLAFASTRGFGRMSVAIEDAGFITHPLIAYLTEHPDAQDFLSMLSKRQMDAFLRLCEHNDLGGMLGWIFGSGFPKATRIKAEGYDGFRYGGQALKPAIEPIYMGQKPFSEATGTANILRWGTGALNIDGSRVGTEGGTAKGRSADKSETDSVGGYLNAKAGVPINAGRWPANLIHDGSDEVIAAFPEATGQQREVNDSFAPKQGTAVYGDYGPRPTVTPRDNGGSAARFFYAVGKDVRCDLCCVLLSAKNAMESACDVNTAETSSPTQNTQIEDTAHGSAAASPRRESEGNRLLLKSPVSTAASSSFQCRQINEHIAPRDALMPDESRIVQNVKSAATLCDLCATGIAHALVGARLHQSVASTQFQGSISGRSEQILRRHLALYVAGRESTDTILTTASLKTLLGSVFHAIGSTTPQSEDEQKALPERSKRFWYSSKADSFDRIGSKHPTVKPVDLMRYLVRLITPPGGTVLDCFAGTGTTGAAAWLEGMNAILIEREPEYQADIAERMRFCLSGPDEKRREIIKRRGLADDDAGPLFGDTA